MEPITEISIKDRQAGHSSIFLSICGYTVGVKFAAPILVSIIVWVALFAALHSPIGIVFAVPIWLAALLVSGGPENFNSVADFPAHIVIGWVLIILTFVTLSIKLSSKGNSVGAGISAALSLNWLILAFWVQAAIENMGKLHSA